jgi:DNA-binding transcriptional ArsR family regulator
MSAPTRKRLLRTLLQSAPLFAALGDEVRLELLTKLVDGRQCSISELSAGSTITRQAITRHLRVLEDAGLVRSMRRGRESLFQLETQSLEAARGSLALISQQWDDALERLKTFVEE